MIQKKPDFFDLIWKFEIVLRKEEYYFNCTHGIKRKIGGGIVILRKTILSYILGYTIPRNVFDMGLSIAHVGPIVVSGKAQIGKNCRIHVCTNIGADSRNSDYAPRIGDDCFISPGAKVFGNICIGNNVAIGANAVVNRSFGDNVTIAGVPAKIVSDKGSIGIIKH